MIAWFARNSVAANLLMLSIIGIGLYNMVYRIPLEVFPGFELDQVTISTTLSGASPSDVEESVTIRLEEAIADLPGIEEITSRSVEGLATVNVQIADGYERRAVLDDIKTRVDGITSLPIESERPSVNLSEFFREVISVVIYGDLSELELKQLGEQIRDEMANLEDVDRVFLESTRDFEIGIEVNDTIIRQYNLTLGDIAQRIANGSLDQAAGEIRTLGGDLLVRTKGQAYNKTDFEDIIVLTRPNGTSIKVRDIATVRDGFEEDQLLTRFDGKPAAIIEVYRTDKQSAIKVASAVRNYIADKSQELPIGVSMDFWRDRSKIVKSRLRTLTNSAIQGGILVFLLLTLLLRPAVAVWVCIGIPVCFLGAFIIMPVIGVTINIISLFAFILVLGIVVDDAIVTGENIYRHQREGSSGMDAAINGTREVAVPVTFGILTTVAAFVPLFFIDGARGAIFAQIPAIVIPVLLFSLVESKLILPAHLQSVDPKREPGWLGRIQQKVSHGFESATLKLYRPLLKRCINNPLLTLSVAISIAIVVFSIVTSGWMRFIFFPRVESETIRINLTMPVTTPFANTDAAVQRIVNAAHELQQKYQDPDSERSLINHILSTSGSAGGTSGASNNRGRVLIEVLSPEERHINIRVNDLVKELRTLIGPIPGAESLSFRAELGRGGEPIDVQFTGGSLQQLGNIATDVKDHLIDYPGVFDIKDSLSGGKQELLLSLKPEAEVLGLDLRTLTQQVRQAFFGIEVQRIQRGRNEVRVMVRFPSQQRQSLQDLYAMTLTLADGRQVPFAAMADIDIATSPNSIYRFERQRTMNVTADIDKANADTEAIKRGLGEFLDQYLEGHPGVRYTLEGEAKEQSKTFGSLAAGLLGVVFVIYALLAIPFKSYWQPLIVMSVIPLGLVGAIIGHWIMGMELTIMSVMGMLALTGVVVNDSLVLVDYINKSRLEGRPLREAVLKAGTVRFRPVILTSLTTFAGLMPLLLEKSTQAQFLIPMAVSLGFGILFATLITLLMIPVLYSLTGGIAHYLNKTFRTGVTSTQSS